MSDSVPADSSEPTSAPGIRIGHVERLSAMEALKRHYGAGRINSLEYEKRSVLAEKAQYESELDELFTDLPLPHSVAPGSPADPGASASSSPVGPSGSPPVVETLTPGAPPVEPDLGPARVPSRGVLNIAEPYATTIVSITPILAVILFFVTGTWIWFLAIPIVALLVYGPDGREGTGPEAARRREREK
ncbi:DUF1707 domain-containing protein [Kineosporia sp. NBRC 101731]|uniref:DUF1707 SHOCT-like domain-containing protein n=1 Tax=Kineosporia sp. NBRC 101731 TaxID=3032199 RepID=UPI002552CFBB|nr:DUF1707 domain-containing protein [Kineosporia sp. NBRC 101731]